MKYSLTCILVLSLFSTNAWSQENGAPQEAPFIQEDTEFQDHLTASDEAEALSLENEISTAEEIIPVEQEAPSFESTPTPPVQNVQRPVRRSNQKRYKKITKDGVDYIQHPQASKGLISIRKDGSYVYKTNEDTKYSESGVFRVGMMDPPRITAKDGTTYEDMYKPGSQAVIFFDYEWQPFDSFGKFGVQGGFGLLMASGKGRYEDPAMQDETPNESYNFFAIPLNLGLVYRMEWMDRQWFAPFVSGGGSYVGVIEARDDGKTNMVGSPGVYGAGGILLNVSAMSRQTAFTLNTEYGIKNLWVALEYRYLKTFSEEVDFSSNIIGAGVAVDY